MLKGISHLFSPELLSNIYEMGHGDEIILVDAHYPGTSQGTDCIRADGLEIPALLEAILPLFELDSYDEAPVLMMDVVPGDSADPAVEREFRAVIDKYQPNTPPIQKLERFEFYERSESAYAIVQTGDTRKYANIILRKGVTPMSR